MCLDGSGRRLITAANDGTTHVWNFSNGQVMHADTVHTSIHYPLSDVGT
jgi:WD40 repeat protein